MPFLQFLCFSCRFASLPAGRSGHVVAAVGAELLVAFQLRAAGRADGIILNPGGYAHYSVAILDALRLCGVPAVEVLLSEPDEHEPFRKTDIVSFGCQGHFIGEGISGYLHAAAYLAQLLRLDGSAHTHLVM